MISHHFCCFCSHVITPMLLVGGFNPSENYEFVSWDNEIPNIWKVIKFHGSKPPTRIRLSTIQSFCEISVKFYLGSFLYGKNSVCVQE